MLETSSVETGPVWESGYMKRVFWLDVTGCRAAGAYFDKNRNIRWKPCLGQSLLSHAI